jgi:hypothetical protein
MKDEEDSDANFLLSIDPLVSVTSFLIFLIFFFLSSEVTAVDEDDSTKGIEEGIDVELLLSVDFDDASPEEFLFLGGVILINQSNFCDDKSPIAIIVEVRDDFVTRNE